MAPIDSVSTPLPRWRRLLLWLRTSIAVLLVTLIVLGIVGQIVRDRTFWLIWLLCMPLAPLGVLAIAFDLLCLGRALAWRRFSLTLLGAATLLLGIGLMTGVGSGRKTAPEASQTITLVQWNLKWGGLRGGARRGDSTWQAIREQLDALDADIVVLSEAPPRFDPDAARMAEERRWLTALIARRGWNAAQCEHTPESEWWYRLVVCSRWPVRKEREWPLFNGYALSVIVETPLRPLRIWVIDGQSNIAVVSRTPMLHELAEQCEQAAARGEPVDILAGDFNTPRRCVGFDRFEEMAGGYELAGQACVGWRASWPRDLPLWDIDHVWLRRQLLLLECHFFRTESSDHRGEWVKFALSPAETISGPQATSRSAPAPHRPADTAGYALRP